MGCSDWIMQSTAVAYLAVAFGEFVIEFHPAFRGNVKVIAVAALAVLTLLNWLGLRSGSRTQELTSLVKVVALLGFVAACFAISPNSLPRVGQIPANVLPRVGILLALVGALQAVIITYDGWYSAIYFMEEDQDPARNLPRSSIAGIVACIAVFLLVNAALLHVLPIPQLAASKDARRRCGHGNLRQPWQTTHSDRIDGGCRQHHQCLDHDYPTNSFRHEP